MWDGCDVVLVNSTSNITSSKYVFPRTTHVPSHECSPYTLMSNNTCIATEHVLILLLKGTGNYAQMKTCHSTSSTKDLPRQRARISNHSVQGPGLQKSTAFENDETRWRTQSTSLDRYWKNIIEIIVHDYITG